MMPPSLGTDNPPMHAAATVEHRKATASGWIGSALEYYDFFIHATAASLAFGLAVVAALAAHEHERLRAAGVA